MMVFGDSVFKPYVHLHLALSQLRDCSAAAVRSGRRSQVSPRRRRSLASHNMYTYITMTYIFGDLRPPCSGRCGRRVVSAGNFLYKAVYTCTVLSPIACSLRNTLNHSSVYSKLSNVTTLHNICIDSEGAGGRGGARRGCARRQGGRGDAPALVGSPPEEGHV